MTVTDFKQIDNKNISHKKEILQSVLFVLFIVGMVLIKKSCDKGYLENSKKTKAIVIERSGGYASHSALRVQFVIDGETIISENVQQFDCYDKYRIGDTVVIKYSIEKNQVVEILGCE